MNNKYIESNYLEYCLRPPTPINAEEYNSLSNEEKKMIKIITLFFVYDKNYNYRLCL